MQILSIDGVHARCTAGGIEREVNLFLLQDSALRVDDFVLVHVGYAIQKIAAADARQRWSLFAEIDALAEEPPGNA